MAYQADGDSEEAVTLTNPTPGTYTVEVDAYSVDGAGGTTEYDYSDSIANPAFGSLTAAGRLRSPWPTARAPRSPPRSSPTPAGRRPHHRR